MSSIAVGVRQYPGATVGIQLEERSPFTGWIPATDIAELEEGLYSATVSDARNPIRARWEVTVGEFTGWFAPSDVTLRSTPTSEQEARLAQAAIAKATRFLVLPESPLGSWGEMTEFGMAPVRPDYQIAELLFGLSFRGLVIDWSSIVTADEVVRVGLSADPSDLPAERLPDVERALTAAEEWIEEFLAGGIGIA